MIVRRAAEHQHGPEKRRTDGAMGSCHLARRSPSPSRYPPNSTLVSIGPAATPAPAVAVDRSAVGAAAGGRSGRAGGGVWGLAAAAASSLLRSRAVTSRCLRAARRGTALSREDSGNTRQRRCRTVGRSATRRSGLAATVGSGASRGHLRPSPAGSTPQIRAIAEQSPRRKHETEIERMDATRADAVACVPKCSGAVSS